MSIAARTLEMQRLASRLGMEYTAKDEWGVQGYLEDFYLFRKGRRRQIRHLLQKKDEFLGTNLYIFDYHFVKGFGKHRRKMAQTVFFIDSKRLGLPQFLMKPENFFHRIGQWLGLKDDIDFVQFPKFSEQYLLQGEDEDFIRFALNPGFLKFFSIEQGWSLEGLNYYLILYRKNKLAKARAIEHLYGTGLHLLQMLAQEEA